MMADGSTSREITDRTREHEASGAAEISMSVLIAEKRDRPLSPLEQTARMITDCEAQIREYDRYYQGSERSGTQELQTEFEQMIKQAQSHKRLFDLSKTNAKAFSQAFSEYYGRCAKELQGTLERYPKTFGGFLKEQKKIAQRANEITKSVLGSEVLHQLPGSVHEPASYLQAGNFIPAVDMSSRSDNVVPVAPEVLRGLKETYHCVRDYHRAENGSLEVVAQACVFYKAYEDVFQKHVTSSREQGRPIPRHTVERTQQELGERRSLLEQELGFPNIPALLEHKGVFSQERRAALTHEYETIQQQGYTGDGFVRLEKLANALLKEQSVYEALGMTAESFTSAEGPAREQEIARHMQRLAERAGGKALTKQVVEVLMNEQIDRGVRAEIANASVTAVGVSQVESLLKMVKGSEQRAVRGAATSGLVAIAEKNKHADIRETARWVFGEIAKDRTQLPKVRVDAIGVLGREGGKEALSDLRKIAGDKQEDAEVSRAATKVLTERIEMLRGIAGDKARDLYERISAIGHLGRMGGREVIEKLGEIAQNNRENGGIRRAVALVLGRIARDREELLEVRLEAIGVIKTLGRVEAMEALGEIARRDGEDAYICGKATEALREIAKNREQPREVRKEAIGHLGSVGGEEAMSTLSEIAQNEQEAADVREKAVWAIGRIARNREQPREVRKEAIGHLERMGGEEAVKALGEIAQSREEEADIHGKATKALGVIARNREQPPEARKEAIGHLERMGGEEAVKAFGEIEENEEEDASVRRAGKWAISKMALNKQKQLDTRKGAIEVLGRMGGDGAMLDLAAIVLDEKEEESIREASRTALGEIARNRRQDLSVRKEAIRYLKRVEEREAVKVFGDIAENEEEEADIREAATEDLRDIAKNREKPPEVRKEAIGYLVRVDGEKAIVILGEIAQDEEEDAGIREAATVALNGRATRGTPS